MRDFYKQFLLLSAATIIIWFLSYVLLGAHPITLLKSVFINPGPSGVLGNIDTSSIPESWQNVIQLVFLAIPGVLQLLATFFLVRALIVEKVPWITGVGWIGLFFVYHYLIITIYASPLGEAGLVFAIHLVYGIAATLLIGIIYSILKLRSYALSVRK